jgi:transcriptional regulator with XRE-family HTH domain
MTKADIDQQVERITKRLVTARERAGLTQSQVAHLLDMSSPATISHYETGERRLSLAMFLRLCDLYTVSPTWALTGHNPDFDPRPVMDALDAAQVNAEIAVNLLQLLESVPHEYKAD